MLKGFIHTAYFIQYFLALLKITKKVLMFKS